MRCCMEALSVVPGIGTHKWQSRVGASLTCFVRPCAKWLWERVTSFFGQVQLSCHVPDLGERNGAFEAGFMCFFLLWVSMQVSFLWKKKTASPLHVFTWLRRLTIPD